MSDPEIERLREENQNIRKERVQHLKRLSVAYVRLSEVCTILHTMGVPEDSWEHIRETRDDLKAWLDSFGITTDLRALKQRARDLSGPGGKN